MNLDNSELSDFVVDNIELQPKSIDDYMVRLTSRNYSSLNEMEEDFRILKNEYKIDKYDGSFMSYAPIALKYTSIGSLLTISTMLVMPTNNLNLFAGITCALSTIYFLTKSLFKFTSKETSNYIYIKAIEQLKKLKKENLSESTIIQATQDLFREKLA